MCSPEYIDEEVETEESSPEPAPYPDREEREPND